MSLAKYAEDNFEILNERMAENAASLSSTTLKTEDGLTSMIDQYFGLVPSNTFNVKGVRK